MQTGKGHVPGPAMSFDGREIAPEVGRCGGIPAARALKDFWEGDARDGTESGHGRVDVAGKRIYFESEECRKKFRQNRSKYLQELDRRKQEASGGEK
mgnify:CR=1 FL=1